MTDFFAWCLLPLAPAALVIFWKASWLARVFLIVSCLGSILVAGQALFGFGIEISPTLRVVGAIIALVLGGIGITFRRMDQRR